MWKVVDIQLELKNNHRAPLFSAIPAASLVPGRRSIKRYIYVVIVVAIMLHAQGAVEVHSVVDRVRGSTTSANSRTVLYRRVRPYPVLPGIQKAQHTGVRMVFGKFHAGADRWGPRSGARGPLSPGSRPPVACLHAPVMGV